MAEGSTTEKRRGELDKSVDFWRQVSEDTVSDGRQLRLRTFCLRSVLFISNLRGLCATHFRNKYGYVKIPLMLVERAHS